MSLPPDTKQDKTGSPTLQVGVARTADPDWVQQRPQRIDVLLEVGVELMPALVIELIRSLNVRPVDREALAAIFDHAAEVGCRPPELAKARKAADRHDYPTAIARLQSYLQRTLVDEVPIADRRLRKSPRFTRQPNGSSAPGLLKR